MTEVLDAPEVEEANALTFLNMTGDITITWSPENSDKIKALVKKKMAEGYSFFSMRKVVIESVKVRRKVGAKGIDTLNNLVIDDETFEKLVKGLDDRDLADTLRLSAGTLAKRKDSNPRKFEGGKRLTSPEEVVKSKQALAIKPMQGG